MKVFVIGSGGREHALLWKLRQSPDVTELYCAPGNAGTRLVAENVLIPSVDRSALRSFALQKRMDVTIFGSELPLALGHADYFAESGLAVVGPSQEAAQLEASKVFAKQFMLEEDIPTAPFEVFEDAEKAIAYVKGKCMPIVIKADGLAFGKGVAVCSKVSDAIRAINACLIEGKFGKAGKRILVEKCLTGMELSYHCFVEGERCLPLVLSQDYKRLYGGGMGPNTGGMGARSPVLNVTPGLVKKIECQIVKPTILGMARRGIPYHGVLYVGIMVVRGEPYVLEYNVRFGDPEAQVIMMRLKSDLFPLLVAMTRSGGLYGMETRFSRDAAVCIVASAPGYPEAKEYKSTRISGLEKASAVERTVLFHSGTKMVGGETMTAGGRVLGVTSLGGDCGIAGRRSRKAMSKINFEGMHYRCDIASGA